MYTVPVSEYAKANGDFELFSDNDSRIKYISGVMGFVALITVLNLIVGTNNVLIAKGLSSPLNYLGIINLAIGLLGVWGTIRLLKKRKKMKQEGQLFE